MYYLLDGIYADFKIEQEDIIKNLQQRNETDNRFYQVRIHQSK